MKKKSQKNCEILLTFFLYLYMIIIEHKQTKE